MEFSILLSQTHPPPVPRLCTWKLLDTVPLYVADRDRRCMLCRPRKGLTEQRRSLVAPRHAAIFDGSLRPSWPGPLPCVDGQVNRGSRFHESRCLLYLPCSTAHSWHRVRLHVARVIRREHTWSCSARIPLGQMHGVCRPPKRLWQVWSVRIRAV